MTKELVYLLGYFYADGFLSPSKKYPVIELQEEDGAYLFKLAKKQLLTVKFRKRERKNSFVKQIAFNITSKKYKKLFENIMFNKENMDIIKDYILKEDYPYFLRGFFDGDGCINLSKNSSRIYFYGPESQNWSFIFDILNSLSISYNHTINIRKNGKHRSSFICISSKYDCVKLFEYLYPNFSYDFGLLRKYKKLLLSKNSIKRQNYKQRVKNTFYIKIYNK